MGICAHISTLTNFFFFFKCHNSGLGKMPRDCFGEGKWPIVVTLEAVSSVGGEMFY